MSLYNMLFGVNQLAPFLLATLNLNDSKVPRFRDCYLRDDKIVIYTRTGGGNRDFYDSEESCRSNYPEYFDGEDAPSGPWNDDLRAHPNYVFDEDDDYDRTYAYFYFSYPDDYAADLKALASADKSHTPSEQWQNLFNTLNAAIARNTPQQNSEQPNPTA